MKIFFEKLNGGIKGSGLKEFLEKCKDGIYKIDITKQWKNRTLEENSYYWGVCIKILSIELGYEPEEVHEIMKDRFLGTMQKLKSDKRVKLKRVKSTASLTTIEFENYLENVRVFAKKYLNIHIPLPNETI